LLSYLNAVSEKCRQLKSSAPDFSAEISKLPRDDIVTLYAVALQICDSLATSFAPDMSCGHKAHGLAEPLMITKGPEVIQLYHGIWWGPERLWVSDLVRLKAERQHFPEEIRSHFKSPAPGIHSAGRHGTFFHILSFHISHSGLSGALMASGVLYEAVSDQWYEPPSQTTFNFSQLPDPPPKSKWRMILDACRQMTLPVDLIAGRYYPHCLGCHQAVNEATVASYLAAPSMHDDSESDNTLGMLCIAGLGKGWRRQTIGTTQFEDRLHAIYKSFTADTGLPTAL